MGPVARGMPFAWRLPAAGHDHVVKFTVVETIVGHRTLGNGDMMCRV